MIVTAFVSAFIMGVIVTLLLEYCLIRRKLMQLPKVEPPRIKQTEKHKLPEVLLKYMKDHVTSGSIGDEAKKKKEEVETCFFLNCLFQFLFRELKDTKEIRRWVVKKMNVEFEELLRTTAGKLFDQIQVQEFNLGETFPIIKSAVVRNVDMQKDVMEVLDLAVDIDYSGGFQMAVKVNMVFGSWAYLSVKITKLKGTARLQLSRLPYTHWSFAFYEEPQMEFEVDSSFNGRPIPQITSLIINQIKRTIRKKHMLPNYKMRFKPFFIKPVEPQPLKDVYISGHKLGVGTLDICVVECSRLLEEQPFSESYLYCTVSVDKNCWTEMRKRFWITLDLEINAVSPQPIGITFKEDLTDNSEMKVVIVDAVSEDSPAFIADVRQGDVVTAVQDVKVISSKQAARLIRSSGERFIMRVERSKAIRSSYGKLQEEMVSLKDLDQDNPNEADTTTTIPDETEDYVSISHKSDEKIGKPTDQIFKQVTETAKLSDKSLPKKGLFLLSTGKRMFFGRHKDVLKESVDVLEDVKQRSSSPSQIPEIRLRNTRSDDFGKKPRDSQSATSSPKKIISSESDSIELSQSAKSSPLKRLVNGFEKRRTYSDTNLNNKVPEDLQADNISLGEFEPSPDNLDAPFGDHRTTLEVKFSKNPVWKESFKFEVSEEEKYVNICLWCKVPPKLDKNERAAKPEVRIPIGYVSLPVADIALSCVLTIQGEVQQTVHLVPSDPKAGARRRFPKYAGKSGFEQGLCYGDITLVFQHTPSKISAKDRTFLSSQCDNIVKPLSSEVSLNGSSVDSRSQKESLENKHKFVAKQFQSVTFCHFCGKKIWMKGAYQCSVCDMICHKKCVEKCQLQTVCTLDGVKLRSRPTLPWHKPIRNTEPERQIGDKEDLDRTGGIFSKFRRDAYAPKLNVSTVKYQKGEVRGITPTRSPQPSPSPSPLPSPTESPVVGRKKFGPMPNEQQAEAEISHVLSSPNLTNIGEECDSADEYSSDIENQNLQNYLQIAKKRHKPGTSGQSLDDTIVMKAKEKGRELFADLSLPDRKKKLDDMVTKLQQEIDKESEHKADLMRMEAEATERAHKVALRIKGEKSDEKMEALMMMIVHYCAGLQHCLDQEEEERRKTEKAAQNSILLISQNSTTSVTENSTPSLEDQFSYSLQTTADGEEDEFQFDIDT